MIAPSLPGPLVSTQWLADNLAGVKIIDGSWRMPGSPPAREDYDRRHIPGAVLFDIDEIADRRSPLPHMLPAPEEFAKAVGAMGIANDDAVVVYDDQGLFSAARVWWTFRAMGHDKVAVLDGGLPKWEVEGRPVTAEKPDPRSANYCAELQSDWVRNADDVRAALQSRAASVADARPAARFLGEMPEPREGLRSGHMPGACSVPHSALFNEDGTMRGAEEIRAIFEKAGVDLEKPVLTTCGSGVTAAVLSLALELAGHRRHGLYDGSWVEWGDARNAEKDYPVIAGQ